MKRRGFLGLVASLPFVRNLQLQPSTEKFLVAGNWRISRANKTVEYIGPAHGPKATVLQFHRWIQDLCDQEIGNGDDELDISDPTVSDRVSDYYVRLQDGWRIDDHTASMLCDGMVEQDNAKYSSGEISFAHPNLIAFERAVLKQ